MEAVKSHATEGPAVRDRILAAAVKLLHEQGIGALTQARVSAMAGVRQSHLTYYFPTRNELLQQAVLGCCGSMLEVLDSPLQGRARSLIQFRKAAEAQLIDRRRARMFAAVTVASEEDPSLKPWIEQFQADMLNRMQQALSALGLAPRPIELEIFRATMVGAIHLDLAVSTDASRRRTLQIFRLAFRQLIRVSRRKTPTDLRKRRSPRK
jgi:AcrR family transcriptional regulator